MQPDGNTSAHPDLNRIRFAPSSDALVQVVGDETVILHLPTERFVALDPVGAEMWRVASTASSVEAALSELLEEFDVDRATLEHDFLAFAERVRSLDLASLEPVT